MADKQNEKKRPYRKRGSMGEGTMTSFLIPKDLKEKVDAVAERDNISKSEAMIRAITVGMYLDNAMEDIKDALKKNPPPYTDEGWEPTFSNCLCFALFSLQYACWKKRRDAGIEDEPEECQYLRLVPDFTW